MERGRNYMGGKGENCHCWKAFVPTYFLKGHFNRKAPKKSFPVQDLLLTFPTEASSYWLKLWNKIYATSSESQKTKE